MQRSGSTFSFNIARELLLRRGLVYQVTANSLQPSIENSNRSDHIILKAHDTDNFTIRLLQLGAIKSVCTVRKPEDSIASWMTVFGFSLKDSISHMQAWLNMYSLIRPYSLTLPYTQIEQNPAHAAWEIAKYICPDADVQEVSSIVRNYSRSRLKRMTDGLRRDDDGIKDIGFSYYDEQTFLHRGHVSGHRGQQAEDRIGLDAVRTIRDALHDWLDEEGNLINIGASNSADC